MRNDHDLILEIQERLDGVEWTPGTLNEIAHLLVESGYRVRDLDDRDRDWQSAQTCIHCGLVHSRDDGTPGYFCEPEEVES